MTHLTDSTILEEPEVDLGQHLQDAFGFASYRPLQEDVVRSAIQGRDLLVVMPTGAGKSLCFQLPALLTTGLTVVVSPLIALMRDQVDALRSKPAFRKLGCDCISSLKSGDEQRALLRDLRAGLIRLIYVSPERFRSEAFVEVLRKLKVARFVVDEAHCISEWGHDFRPDYLALKSAIKRMGNPPITAATATATQRVQRSIVENLGMKDPDIYVGGFDRPNLHWSVHRCKSESDRLERIAKALPKLLASGGSGLIYVPTRRGCEEVAAAASGALSRSGHLAAAYHAGLDGATRERVQDAWITGEIAVLVATSAFGMGIDKADVRFVVHAGYPESLEAYYQEAGRAGRDGKRSRCVVLTCFSDKRTREWFVENESLSGSDVKAAHWQLVQRDTGGPIALDRLGWSQYLGGSDVKSRMAISELERAGLLERLGDTGSEIMVTLLSREIPPASMAKIERDLSRQRRERLERLTEIMDYCKTESCRRRTILDHFGDTMLNRTSGPCCDNCDRPALPEARRDPRLEPAPGRVSMPDEMVQGNIYHVLQAIDALRPAIGKTRLNQLLRGSGSKEVERYGAAGCPLFGCLKTASTDQVDKLLTALIAKGLMHQADEDGYFVCTVTVSGREAWEQQVDFGISLPGKRERLTERPPAAVQDLAEADTVLYEALKTWNRTRAAQDRVPSYCILTDLAMRQIAATWPKSSDDLKCIRGIGNAKLSKFGDDVLKLVSEHLES